MKVSKLIIPNASAALLLSSCCHTDQPDAAYDPGAYAPGAYGQNPGAYDQSVYNQDGVDPYVNGGQHPTDYGSESGDVVTLPGDDIGGPDIYDPSGIDQGSPAGGNIYTVKKGDNIYRIAKRHDVTMQAIIEANGLSSTTIYPGQQLIIP